MRLALSGVGKRFGGRRGELVAVDGVDLVVEAGELFVLLGPSGCGKSTLLELVAGLERPTTGTIRFDDRVVAGPGTFVPPRRRDVAMVFQSYALYPHLTVFENIAFPLRLARRPGSEVAGEVHRAAAALAIDDLLAARPAELSGGQRQRVAIARALVRRPALFLLDEPLSNLDAQLRASTRAELKELQERLGVTAVYVTHDQVEAMTLGDRVAVLRRGRIEQVGTPDELYDAPTNAFVAAFVGAPPMNLLAVPVERTAGGVVVRLGDGHLPVAADRVRGLPAGAHRGLLGIRPEDVRVLPPETVVDLAGGLAGAVELVEPMGRDRLIHVKVGATRIGALSAEPRWQPGDRVGIALELRRAHLFPAGGDRRGPRG